MSINRNRLISWLLAFFLVGLFISFNGSVAYSENSPIDESVYKDKIHSAKGVLDFEKDIHRVTSHLDAMNTLHEESSHPVFGEDKSSAEVKDALRDASRAKLRIVTEAESRVETEITHFPNGQKQKETQYNSDGSKKSTDYFDTFSDDNPVHKQIYQDNVIKHDIYHDVNGMMLRWDMFHDSPNHHKIQLSYDFSPGGITIESDFWNKEGSRVLGYRLYPDNTTPKSEILIHQNGVISEIYLGDLNSIQDDNHQFVTTRLTDDVYKHDTLGDDGALLYSRTYRLMDDQVSKLLKLTYKKNPGDSMITEYFDDYGHLTERQYKQGLSDVHEYYDQHGVMVDSSYAVKGRQRPQAQ